MIGNFLERNTRYLDVVIALVACLWVLYQFAMVGFVFHDVIQLENTHLLGALSIFCLARIRRKPHSWPFYFLLLLASAVPLIYVAIFYGAIADRVFALTRLDIIMGVFLLAAVLVACYAAYGWILTSLACLFLAYFYLGNLLPGFLQTAPIRFDRSISILTIGFTGIYGVALAASASYIFLFLLFGSLLNETGGTRFFIEFGKLLTNKLRLAGGMGQTAVIGSGLVGMVTGSAVANVAITGAFTIPAMKKAGYPPEVAGAIEAVASSGGQIIPPVMGAVAFVMAAFTGISYINICTAAVIPAAAYVACAAVSVELLAKRRGMVWQENPVDMRLLLVRMPLFLVPLASLTLLLMMDLSPMYAAVAGIVTLFVVSLFLRETRLSLHRLVEVVVDGAVSAAPIAIACACVGIIVEILGFTGLDIKLPSMVEIWSQGHLFLALVITTLICILLGCGLPTIPIYVVVSITAAPVLIKMGVSLMAAHFFVLFLGVSAFITPPVAMAALVAAGIAESPYMMTAVQASRIGIMIYLIPFLYVYNPIVLGQFAGHAALEVVMVMVSLFLGILSLCAVLHGFYLRRAYLVERLVLGASFLGFWGYIIAPSYLLFAGGLAFLAGVTLYQIQVGRSAVLHLDLTD